ncbi:hypothetical protein BH09BAC2_BH09BAC2_08280 [soil metagenome]
MFKINIKYWLCQIIGWGSWILINLFIVYLFAADIVLKNPEKQRIFYATLFLEFFFFILATHLLRLVLKKIKWMQLPFNKVLALFIIGVTLTGLFGYYGARNTARLTGFSSAEYEKKENLAKANESEQKFNLAGTAYYKRNFDLTTNDSVDYKSIVSIKKSTGWSRNKAGKWEYEDQRKGRFWFDIIFTFILVALWLLIYIVWHYIEKDRKDQVAKLTLEKTVKELELKTIKSHINPHFIFNSLNSIRALVEENPRRARSAITELSNILRSSMQVEKMETVPLVQELNIVQDYLALEQMRFEERLKVELNIDPETLELPVPPMMLQTLVENAIKHGISKEIKGGKVMITSKIKHGEHHLIVQNTGKLNGIINKNGFGIKSTQDRLIFLYDGKGSFEISDYEGMVQSKVSMPLGY